MHSFHKHLLWYKIDTLFFDSLGALKTGDEAFFAGELWIAQKKTLFINPRVKERSRGEDEEAVGVGPVVGGECEIVEVKIAFFYIYL